MPRMRFVKKESGFIEERTLNNLYNSIKTHFTSVSGDRSLKLDWFGGEPLLYYDKMLSRVYKKERRLYMDYQTFFIRILIL